MVLIPDNLIENLKSGLCVAWCGAGISLMSGMPTWAALVKQLVGICEANGIGKTEADELHLMLEQRYYDDIVDFCRAFLGEGEYRQSLVKIFRSTQRPSSLHSRLANLPFSAILTTNYDKIIENLITQRTGQIPAVITCAKEESPELWLRFARNEFFVLKIHGDIDRPSTIVLSAGDYTELIFGNPGFMQFLQRLLASKSVLFVGTSLSDEYVRRILEEIRYLSNGAGMPHYAVCPRLGPVRSQLWRKRFNISVISYDPVDENLSSYEAAVVGVLEAIGDRLKQT